MICVFWSIHTDNESCGCVAAGITAGVGWALVLVIVVCLELTGKVKCISGYYYYKHI